MQELLNDDDIVIRPADKGSGINVMDTKDYVTKLNDKMANNTTYKHVAADNTTTRTVYIYSKLLRKNVPITMTNKTKAYIFPWFVQREMIFAVNTTLLLRRFEKRHACRALKAHTLIVYYFFAFKLMIILTKYSQRVTGMRMGY